MDGASLRQAREAAGVKLVALARRVQLSPQYLRNIESGRRRVTPDILRAYASVIGADVDRREVLGIAASLALPSLLVRSYGTLLSPEGRRTVEEWHTCSDIYGRDYLTVGSSELGARLLVDLAELQLDLATHPELWAVAARLLILQGRISPPREALGWFELAVSAADRTGDVDLRVWTRARAGLALVNGGIKIAQADTFATDALAMSDKASTGRLAALLATANVRAHRDDPAGARQADTEALRVADLAVANEGSDYVFSGWRVATYRSMLYARLADERQAAAIQAEADRALPSPLPRFGAHARMQHALILARSGASDEARTLAHDTLEALPEQRRSTSLRLMQAEVIRTASRR